MRVALLGPVGQRAALLEPAAAFCLTKLNCHALFYLGNEESVRADVATRRERLNDPATSRPLWRKTTECIDASTEQVHGVHLALREQYGWSQLTLLGSEAPRRLTSPSSLRWVFTYDVDELQDYDRSRATVIAYGASEAFTARMDAGQVLLAPGSWDSFGLMVVDDSDAIAIQVFNDRHERVAEAELERPDDPAETDDADTGDEGEIGDDAETEP